MAKVRFLKEGGNPNGTQEEKVDENLLTVGDMQLDRNRLTDTFRDFDDFSGWSDKYKGLSGNKIRNAVASRARELANGILKGKVSLEDLSTFTSQNQQFASDGKTKKRFLGGYDSRDNNTVNAIAARYVLDVMGRSKYRKPEQTTAETDADELQDYSWDYMSGMLGDNDTDRQAAITGLSQIEDRNKRLGVIRQWYANALKNIEKDKASKKYKEDTDWSQYDQYKQIQDWLVDDATYQANKENILGTGTLGARLLGTIANLMGDAKTDKVSEEDDELAREKKRAEEIKKKQDVADIRRQNDFSEYKSKAWAEIDPTVQYNFGITGNPYVDNEEITKAYTPHLWVQGENGLVANKDYENSIYDVMGGIYKDYITNFVKGGITDPNRMNAYWNGEYKLNDRYIKDAAPKTRSEIMGLYSRIISAIHGNKFVVPTTFNDEDNTVLVYKDGVPRQMNLKQAINEGYMNKDTADRWIEQAYNRRNSFYRTGGVIKKGQLGMRMDMPNTAYDINLADQTLLENYKKYMAEQAVIEKEKQNAANKEAENQERIRNRVKEKKGALTTPEAKAAMETDIKLGTEDAFRIGAAASNLASAIAGLTGFSPASTAAGLVGTAANAVADKLDDSISTGEWWGNLGINLGLDALSLIPIAGTAAAGTKVMRLARSISPMIGALAIMNTDFSRTADLTRKLVDGGWKSMSRQDWTDLMNGLSQMSGLVRTGGNAARGFRARNRAAADSGMSQIKIRRNGKQERVNITNEQWNKIQNARYTEDGRLLSDGKARVEQNKVFQSMFGEDAKLDEVLKSRYGWLPSTRREVYDYEYEKSGSKWWKTTGDVLEGSQRGGRKNKPQLPSEDIGTAENKTPSITGGINRVAKKAKEKVTETEKKVSDKVSETVGKGKNLPDGKVTINGDEYMRKTIKSTGKQKYFKLGKNGLYEEVVNPSKKITSAEYKKLGGRLIAHRFANGGSIPKYDGGGTVRNTYSNPNPLDFGGFTNVWGKTVGSALYDTLAGIRTDADRDKIIDDSRSIQTTYKGAVDVSGVGYNQNNLKRFDEVSQHQTNFRNRFNIGNEAIERGVNNGLIFRRGNTGDSLARNNNDGLHGIQDATRTIGAAFSDADKAAFEASPEYQRTREIATSRRLMYRPIKDLSTDGKYYYGFEKLPDVNHNPVSLAAMAKKPDIPTQIKPLAVNQGAPVPDPSKKKDGKTKTNPADGMQEKNPNGGFNATGLLDLIDPIAGTLINNRAVRKAQEGLRPNLVDAYRTQVPVENDYWAKRNAEETAARYDRFGRRAADATADAALGNATWLAAMSKGQDAIREGNDASRQLFYKTRGMAMEAENENTARWTQAANANRASMNNIKALKANMEANRITGNYTGIWQPWLRERKANALMEGKLRQAQALQGHNMQAQTMYDNMVDGRTAEEWTDYLKTEDGKEKYNEFKTWNIQNNPAYKSSSSYVTAKDYFPIFAARGARIRSSYSMNLGLDDFAKEFFKNERNAKNAGIKERIASTSGMRIYAREASQNITDYNKMMSYARKRK